MQRTLFSSLGAVVLLGASLWTGLDGLFWKAAGQFEDLIKAKKAQIERLDRKRDLSELQRRELAKTRKQLETLEKAYRDPEARKLAEQQARKMNPYGLIRATIGMFGIIAGLALLLGLGFGEMASTVASSLGMLSCVAGAILHPDRGYVLYQVILLALFALAFAGVRSIKD